jgi:hypothetical protein
VLLPFLSKDPKPGYLTQSLREDSSFSRSDPQYGRSGSRGVQGIDKEIDRLWAEEAERRVSQIEAGEVKLIPGEEVFSRIQAKNRKSSG